MATLNLPDNLFDRLQTLAEQKQQSVAALIEQSLDDCVDKQPVSANATLLHDRIYPLVVAAMTEGMIIRNAENRIIDCNASAERILGLSREQMVNQGNARELNQIRREDGKQFPTETMPTVVAIETGEPQYNVIIRLDNPDGTQTWISNDVYPLFISGGDKPDYVVSVFTDITAYRHATREAEKSAAYWRYMSELSFEGLAITEDGIVTDVNNRLLEILGYERDEIIGMHDMSFVADSDKEYVASQSTAKTTLPYEHLGIRKDGRAILLEIQGRTLQDTDHRIRVVAVRDVTQQRKTEHELERTRALLQAAVDQSPAGIIIADVPDLDIQLVNQTALRTRGYDTHNPEKYYDLEAWRTHYPDGTPYPIDALPLVRAAFGETVQDEEMVNGNGRWVLVNATPIRNNDGIIIASIAVFLDITARKQAEKALRDSEERYRRLLEAAPTAIAVIRFDADKTPRFIYVNPATVDLYGAKAATQIVGMSVLDITVPEHHEKLRQRADAYIDGAPKVVPTETKIQRLDGSIGYTAISSAAIEYEGQPAVMSVITDITDKYLAQEALRQSEERYRNLLDSAPVAIALSQLGSDKIVEMVYANTATTTLYGVKSAEELYGKGYLEFFPPTDKAKSVQRSAEFSQNVNPGAVEYILQLRDGTQRHVRTTSINIIYNEQPAFLSVLMDVTERYTAEQALRQSEERYRSLLESSPAAISVNQIEADNRLRIVYVNPTGVKLYGAKNADEVVGRTVDEFMVADYINQSQQRTADSVHGAALAPTEYQMQRIDGKVITTLVGSILIDYEGQPAFLSVFNDVSERKEMEIALRQSEERYRRMLENAPVGIFVVQMDDKATIRYINPTGAAILAAPSTADIIGLSSYDLMPPESLAILQQRIDDLTVGTKTPTREYALKRLDGDFVYVRAAAIPITYDDQPSALTVLIDVTERRKAEEALRQSESRYRNLLEQAPVAMTISDFDNDGNLSVRYMNAAAMALHGYSQSADVLGKRLMDMVIPAERVKSAERARDLENKQSLGTTEYTILRPDGTTRIADVGSIQVDYEGHPAILSVLNNITERKQSESALRRRDAILGAVAFAAEQFLRNRSLEAGMQAVLERLGQAANMDRAYIFKHQTVADGSVITNQIAEWVAEGISAHLDNPLLQNVPVNQRGWESWHNALMSGEVVAQHTRQFPAHVQDFLKTQDIQSLAAAPIFVGQSTWGYIGFDICQSEREWSQVEMDALKAAAETLGAAIERKQDEEALHQSEERLRLALSSTGTGIWRWELASNEVEWSDGVEPIFGVDSQSFDGTYQAYTALVHPDDLDKVANSIQQALANPADGYYVEHRTIAPDGKIHWIEGKGVVLLDEQDRPVRMFGIVENITERKEAQLALQEREIRINRQNEALLELATVKALGSGDLSTALREITRVTSETLAVARISIWFYVDDNSAIRCELLYNARVDSYTSGNVLTAQQYPAYFAALRQNRVIVANDAYADSATYEFAADYLPVNGIVSLLDAPIRVGGKTVGVVCGEQVGTLYHWSLDDQHFMSGVADLVALAIEARDRQLAQEALRRNEENALEFQHKLRQVHDITLELAQQPTLADIYRRAVELGRSVLGFDRLGLWVLNPARDKILGTFGTDEQGQLRDEQSYAFPITAVNPDVWERFRRKERIISLQNGFIKIPDFGLEVDGWIRVALLWNGTEGIGWLSADNYLHKAEPRPYEFDLLTIYATALGSLITQRNAEETALAFQEKLRQVHEIGVELTHEKTLPDIYRRAVELGRNVLGFDRVGLWLMDRNSHIVQGTFGTDETGQIRNEQHYIFPITAVNPDVLEKFNNNERILSHASWFIHYPGFDVDEAEWSQVPAVWNRVAMLWNGSEGIGWLSVDNYLSKAEPRSFEFDLLTIYATTVGSLITQRRAEETALAFQEKLRLVQEIGITLSQEKTSLDIYRRAVELGRSELGFDRLGLWLIDRETQRVKGTFGTDESGIIRDETRFSHPLADDTALMEVLNSKQRTLVWRDGELKNQQLESVGNGWRAATFLWNGAEDIGWLSTDNMLSKRPIRAYELDLLTVFGSSLGHLITQRQIQEALQRSEETALEFQQKLRQIHEITLELAQQSTLADVYRRAVELGRSVLGFDRLGLWVLNPTRDTIMGTFGTDTQGKLRDEQHIAFPIEDLIPEVMGMFERKERLVSRDGVVVANPNYELDDPSLIGWNAVALLWNGNEGVGWLSTDNYLLKAAPRSYEFDLLTVYATALGSLITQRKTQEALQRSEETALEFQQRLREVHEITLELAQQSTLADVYRRAVELGRSVLGFERLGLWILSADREMMLGTFGTDETGQVCDEQHLSFSLEAVFPEVLEVFKRKERIISQDGGVIKGAEYEIDPTGWNLVAILWNGTEGIGWLSADNYLFKAPIRPYDRDLLTIYATALGSMITQRQSEEQLTNLVSHLTLLGEIDRAILRSDSPESIAESIVQPLKMLMDCDFVGITQGNPADNTIAIIAHTDDTPRLKSVMMGDLAYQLSLPLARGETVQTGIDSTAEQDTLLAYLLPRSIQWMAVLPLLYNDRFVGAIALGSNKPQPFSAERMQLAEQVAAQLSVSMNQTSLNQQIQKHSIELEKSVNRLQLLAEIDRAILQAESVESIAEATIHPLQQLVGCDYVGIVLKVKSSDQLSLLAHTALQPFTKSWQISDIAREFIIPNLERGEVAAFTGMKHYPNSPLQDYLIEIGVESGAIIPLIYDAELVGWVNLGMFGEQAISDENIHYAQQVIRQLSLALRQSTLYQRVQDYAESLELKVAERTRQLEEKASEMEAFSYSISHDLRAPLRAINGFSDLLMEAHSDELTEKMHHYLDRIHSNSRRMGELIDALLMLSRIGRTDIRKTQLEMTTFVRGVLSDMQADFQTGGAMILVDDLPACHADAALLKQVYINLVSNAIKYSQKTASPIIHIGYELDDNKQVVYYVRDNGVGFDMKYADKLFGVFQRLHDAREYEGTGIGLATVQRIISRHGGRVWATGRVNEGATFYFTLPNRDNADGNE
jgi:PAS domain S-box-containing protein